MTGDNTTGPLTFGRWSQPAALINAGRVTPDPYPLEVILFCATCGEQFFGAHVTTGSTQVTDRSHEPGGRHQAEGVRVYRTCCNCRPGPLPAGEVELRVYAETHVYAFGTDTVAGLTSVHYALLTVRIFSRIEVGPTVDHVSFTARI